MTQETAEKIINTMVLCQILFDLMEEIEKEGYYSHALKNRGKMFKEELEKKLELTYAQFKTNQGDINGVYEAKEAVIDFFLGTTFENKMKIIDFIQTLK